MTTMEPWRSPNSPDLSAGSYSKHAKNADNFSAYSSRKAATENLSENELLAKQREKIQEWYIKDAKYRQRETELQRQNDYLKKQITKLEMKVEKLEEHRAQDAEALLDQEDKLSKLKGRYRKTDNPNEVDKINKSIQALTKQENDTFIEIKKWTDGTTRIHDQVSELAPKFYENLRQLKFHGDKAMNEILLRQINIYIERLLDKSMEFEKLKLDISKHWQSAKPKDQIADSNRSLRLKLKDKYQAHDQLKKDTIEDNKQLYSLQRKLNFYETDYMIEREENDKSNKSNGKSPQFSKSIISEKKSIINETGVNVFNSKIITQAEQEEVEVGRRNEEILYRLRERLEQTKHKDFDIQKLIDKLPIE